MNIFKNKKINKALCAFLAICLVMGTQLSAFTEYADAPGETEVSGSEAAVMDAIEAADDPVSESTDTISDDTANEDTDAATDENTTDAASGNDTAAQSGDNTAPDVVTEPSDKSENGEITVPIDNVEPSGDAALGVGNTPSEAVTPSEATTPNEETKQETETKTETSGAGGGGSSVVTSAEPTESIEPTNSAEPTESVAPTESIEPTESVEPTIDPNSTINPIDVKLNSDPVYGQDGTVGWYIDGTELLLYAYSSGSEAKFDTEFSSASDIPWKDYVTSITTVTISDTIGFNGSSAYLFNGMTSLTSITGLEKLDTSGVTNMRSMFDNCMALTSVNLSNFDTSQVTNMAGMFGKCNAMTTIDLSSFDTSNVTDMYCMFFNSTGLTSLDLSNFDTSKVTRMKQMFASCYKLQTLDVSSFNTENVTNMDSMFNNCSSLTSLDLSSFYTPKLTTMANMFSECSKLVTLDVPHFDTSNITDMTSMFNNCKALTTLDLSSFDTSKVTSMAMMFCNCNALTTLDVSSFDTSKVTSMAMMFYNCSALTTLDVSSFDTSQVTDMLQMFYNCKALTTLDLSSFNTSNVVSMMQMFYNCNALRSLNLSNFNTSNVTSMLQMFGECNALTSLDLSSFDTSEVVNMFQMFINCKALTSLDISSFDTSKVTDMSGMFYGCSALTSLDISNFDTSNVTDMSSMFYSCGVKELNLSNFNTSNVTNMSSMFAGCSSLVKLDISSFDTSKVTDMSGMFYFCPYLTGLDLSNFDTSKVTDMSYMFAYNYYWTYLNVSSFNTSNVTNMTYMFTSCQRLREIDVSSFNTENVTSMANMFMACYSLQRIDVSGFNTSNVNTMESMFDACYSLTEVDLSNFDVSNVTTMKRMFMNCYYIEKIILPKSDTPNLTDTSYMFMYCYEIKELDFSYFNTLNVTNLLGMFYYANLSKITLGPNAILNANSYLWSTLNGGTYLVEEGKGVTEDNYVGSVWDLYSYQAQSSNRVDEQGNAKYNVYSVCTIITYDPNGGVWPDGSTDVKHEYYTYGETWTITSEQPVNSGATFMGWDRIRDYTASLYDLKTSLITTGWESTITLYADWEGRDRLAYNTTDSVDGEGFATIDVSGDDAPAVECEFTIKALDGAPEPTKTDVTVSFNGEGSQNIDFGTITFLRTGLYHYEIKQSSSENDGWVYNNGSKIVNITVSKNEETGEVYISSLEGVKFYNYYNGGKHTKNLVEQDKADNVQKNHQQSVDGNESLYKSANWTNQENGEANIDIVYNNTYSDTESETALYIFTNCTAHNFTKDIAKQNIKFLLQHYDTVVAVCSMKTRPIDESDVTYEKFIFKSSEPADDIDKEIDLYLNTIDFRIDMHLSAVWQLSCFDTCLDMFEPDAVFFSYDGARGYDNYDEIMIKEIFGMSEEEFANAEYPEPILKHYDETLEKLAEILKRNEFYIMIANGINNNSLLASKDYDTFNTTTQDLKNMTYLAMMTIDPLTMSTEEGRNKIKAEISAENNGINIRNYVATELSTYATEIYSYAQTMESTVKLKIGEKYSITDVIDSRFNIAGDITVQSVQKQSDGSYVALKEGEDYTLTITDDAASGGKKVQVNFIKWNGIPAKISIPVVLKDVSQGFYDMNGDIEDFADTNVGDVTVNVTDTIYDGSKGTTSDANPRVSIQTESPKLFLDTDYIVSTIGVLPETGGMGIGIYIVGGLTLMILAAYVWKKQLERER